MSDVPIAVPIASLNRSRSSRETKASRQTAARTVSSTRGANSRLGSRQLASTQRQLSGRDEALLRSVEALRVATTRHLELLHFADAATPLTAARKTRRTLDRLIQLNLLRRLERRVGGLYGGSVPAAYALTAPGQRLVQASSGAPRRRVGEPGLPYLAHTLAIADLFVGLHVGARRERDVELLAIQTEPSCWRVWQRLDGSSETLRPDLYVALGTAGDELRWFIEVDLGTEHRPAIVRKAHAYQRYLESGTEQARDGVFPWVVWVVPDTARAELLSDALSGDHTLTAELFRTALAETAADEFINEARKEVTT